MKKSVIGAVVLAAGVFGVGYTAGQLGGVTGSSAASAVATPGATLPDGGQFSGYPHGPGGNGQDTPHADGTVKAINGNTLTIAAGNDPAGTTEYTKVTTVILSSSTQYEADHDSTATATKSSIKVGSYIIVDGTLSSDGKTITASQVGINPGGPVPGR